MWLITPDFFISVVQKDPRSEMLCLRARAEGDLEILREKYLPSLGKTQKNKGTDYIFRAFAQKGAVAQAMAAIARDINYSNMKNETAKRRGAEREHIFHKVWAALLALEPKRPKWNPQPATLWDDARWDDDLDTSDLNDPYDYDFLTAQCPVCDEMVILSSGEVDPNLPEEELLAAVAKIAEDIGQECEWNDSGSHYGPLPMEALNRANAQ